MAMMAAMKKVLSPNSETNITEQVSTMDSSKVDASVGVGAAVEGLLMLDTGMAAGMTTVKSSCDTMFAQVDKSSNRI